MKSPDLHPSAGKLKIKINTRDTFEGKYQGGVREGTPMTTTCPERRSVRAKLPRDGLDHKSDR